jgi:hypothetical protein
MIKPILLYGCEVWGFCKNEVLERVHLKFCKILLNLKSSTPNYMVYGELGRYPIDIDIKVRIISYWARLLSGKQAKFSNVFNRLSRNLNENGDTNLNWVYFIRTILNECGFTYIWETENVNNKEWLKCVVKQRLIDQFVQNWQTSLSDSSKALNYRIFKTKFEFEEYFNILNIGDAIRLCRFRTTNHILEEAACVYRLKRNTLKHSGIHRLNSDNYINYSTCFLYQYFSIYRFQSVDSDLLS